jgi:hypothetical protein
VSGLTAYLGEQKSPGEDVSLTLLRDSSVVEFSLAIGGRQ